MVLDAVDLDPMDFDLVDLHLWDMMDECLGGRIEEEFGRGGGPRIWDLIDESLGGGKSKRDSGRDGPRIWDLINESLKGRNRTGIRRGTGSDGALSRREYRRKIWGATGTCGSTHSWRTRRNIRGGTSYGFGT